MSWTTVGLILVAWCLVSVVAGFALAFFFGGMNRIHPDELAEDRMMRLRRKEEREKLERLSKRFPTRRVEGRVKTESRPAPYRPLVAQGVPDPPLDDE